MRITFEKNAKEFVLSAFGYSIGFDQNIINSSGKYVLDSEQNPVHIDDFEGIRKDLIGNYVLMTSRCY